MKKVIFYLLFFTINNPIKPLEETNNTEFIVKKKNINQSSSKIRELIFQNFGNILKVDLNLDKFSFNLRDFLLKEIDTYLNEEENSFLLNANKSQLQELLNESVNFKKDLTKNLIELDKKLENLKCKFKFNLKKIKDINGKL